MTGDLQERRWYAWEMMAFDVHFTAKDTPPQKNYDDDVYYAKEGLD